MISRRAFETIGAVLVGFAIYDCAYSPLPFETAEMARSMQISAPRALLVFGVSLAVALQMSIPKFIELTNKRLYNSSDKSEVLKYEEIRLKLDKLSVAGVIVISIMVAVFAGLKPAALIGVGLVFIFIDGFELSK